MCVTTRPAAVVLVGSTAPAPVATLATTGTDVGGLLLVGAVAVAAGAALVRGTRKGGRHV